MSVEGPCLEFAPHSDPVLVAQFYAVVEIFEKSFQNPVVSVVSEGKRSRAAAFDVEAFQWSGRGADVVARPWPTLIRGLVADPPRSVTTPTRGIFPWVVFKGISVFRRDKVEVRGEAWYAFRALPRVTIVCDKGVTKLRAAHHGFAGGVI